MFFDNPIINNIVDPLNRIDDVSFDFSADNSSSVNTSYTMVFNMNSNKYDKFGALFNGLIDMSVEKKGTQVTVTCWSYKDQQLIMRWSEQNG